MFHIFLQQSNPNARKYSKSNYASRSSMRLSAQEPSISAPFSFINIVLDQYQFIASFLTRRAKRFLFKASSVQCTSTNIRHHQPTTSTTPYKNNYLLDYFGSLKDHYSKPFLKARVLWKCCFSSFFVSEHCADRRQTHNVPSN